MRLVTIALAALALSACAHTRTVTVEKTVEVKVAVPAPCPDKAERARLRTLRPVPLRSQPMPPTAVERTGRAIGQLGKYEAEGGYADQVDAALDRCQGD